MPSTKKTLKQIFVENSDKVSTVMGIVSVIVELIAGFLSNSMSIKTIKLPGGAVDILLNGNPTDLAVQSLEAELKSVKDEQSRLNQRIEALSQITDQTALSAEISGIKNSVNDLDIRFSKIENILVQDPQKSLEIPLMRKDLDNLVTTTDLQIALLRQDAERSYNLMLVTIVALAIGILAPALGNLFKKNQNENSG